MAVLLLARHAETDWNLEHRFQGSADIPLNERGREQATELAGVLASDEPIDAIYTSDLARAATTAEIVGAALGLRPVADPALREMDVRRWAGLTQSEIESRFPGELERWRRGEDVHGTGTHVDLRARVIAAMARIGSAHSGGRVLLVTHGGVIRVVQRALNSPVQGVPPNCSTWACSLSDVLALPTTSPNNDGETIVV